MHSSLKEIHQTQLELLIACRTVCERHGLPYFLAQGTLLGAVRYGGFIPWDDDIDIIMPASAIKEFMVCFQEEMGEKYFFEDFHTEENCPQPWAKIRKNGTTSMPRRYQDMPIHWGICMDIFPLYEVGDGRLAHFAARMRFKFAKKFLAASYTPFEEAPGIVNRIVAAFPLKLRRIAAGFCLKGLERNTRAGRDCFTLCRNSRFLPREWLYGEETYLEFEGERFRVPTDTHAFLTEMYGDYMTPPPPEEQGGHDLKMGQIIWDTQRDYTAYRSAHSADRC